MTTINDFRACGAPPHCIAPPAASPLFFESEDIMKIERFINILLITSLLIVLCLSNLFVFGFFLLVFWLALFF